MVQAIDLRGLVRPQLVEATKREDNPNIAEFRLQPLERGFGHTLGNAMRRMLLSSLRGSAVWGFRIEGVLHEHQTIPGVAEDVHQIIGNLKTLTLSLDEDVEDAILRINVRGAGAITAGSIEAQGGVTVLSPGHPLFTLQDDKDFTVELYVNKGRGYVEADQHPADRSLPVDLVRIDSIYSPVRRVNFHVSETRVGQRTDYDRLILEIWTDGRVTAGDALIQASAILQHHLDVFVGYDKNAVEFEEVVEKQDDEQIRMKKLLNMSVNEIELSVRAANCLNNANITTVGQLAMKSEAEMLKYRNFGKKSLNEIKDKLQGLGLSLGMKFEAGLIESIKEEPKPTA